MKIKPVEFSVGEWVWYWYQRRYIKSSPKWQKMYLGPYLVIRVIEPVNFVIQKSSRAKPFVVHDDKLKRCCGNTPASWLNNPATTSNEDTERENTSTNNEHHEVESLPTVTNYRARQKSSSLKPSCVSNDDISRIHYELPQRVNRRRPIYLSDYQQ